ncbi:adenylate/guanylate cyclase domain-containing protein, partial [Candidatus Peregrinibacteria bacterium]|nr:adenylate/guanylate cyclase domain-containing protein [Candidatus Peregrinibacteria bacterium]
KFFKNEKEPYERFDLQKLLKIYEFPLDGNSVKIPLEDRGQMRIHFKEPFYTYPQISFSDVVKNTFETEWIRGRIILIGATDFSLQDTHPVPNGKMAQMPGIEIHANTMQTILDQSFRWPGEFGSRIALIAFIAFFSTAIFLWLGMGIGAISAVLIAGAYFFLARIGWGRGWMFDMVLPMVAIFFTYILSILYRYFTEFRQKLFLKKAFSRYVSAEIVQDLSEHPEKLMLGGERRVATVFFSDICDFTAFSESVPVAEMVSQMNEYFSVMTEVIMAEGGTLDKYEGDAIMAFFGAPIAYEDHAIRAIRTAVNCRKEMEMVNEKWTREGRRTFNFRIGINTGEVIVGNIGSSERFNYTVMGDNVNVASRLEKANKELGTKTLVSETTYEAVKSETSTHGADFQFIKHGPIKIRGKNEEMEVYEVVASLRS